MYKLEFSVAAQKDMEELGDYISNTLQNPSSAMRLVRSIKAAVFKLCDFPEMGALLKAEENIVGYRYLICGSYMVFYHISESSVLVDRVLYGRRNYLSMLFDGEQVQDDYSE